jgi:hypothetical protein
MAVDLVIAKPGSRVTRIQTKGDRAVTLLAGGTAGA